MGAIWELSRVGELGRNARCGGGVVDMARGLFAADAVGDEPGDDGAAGGRASAKRERIFSSSEGVLISTSLSSEDKKDGASSLARSGDRAAEEEPARARSARTGVDTGDLDEMTGSFWVPIRRVRGRLSRLAGSGGGSMGDPVVDLDFLLRPAGLDASTSMALSKAPHARRSSRFSRGAVGPGRRCSLTC